MKRSIISAAVLSAVFMSAGAFAADTETGQLTIEGKIINSPCSFKDNDNNSTITLDDVDISRFAGLNVGDALIEEYSDQATPMKIICPKGTTLKTVSINRGEFTAAGVLRKETGSSDGVGFKLKLGKNPLTKDQANNIGEYLSSQETAEGVEYTLDFSAQYARSDATPVIAGTLSSVLVIGVSAE